MLPKVHLTSNVVSQFVCILLQEDPIKLGIKMESTVLAVLAPQNVKVTENPNATLEFIRYERMVQEHLANNLQGSVEALEALAWAVSDEKCKFIRITRQEADECMKHIENMPYHPHPLKMMPQVQPLILLGIAWVSSTHMGCRCGYPWGMGGGLYFGYPYPYPYPGSEYLWIAHSLTSPPSIPNVSIPSPPLATETSTSHGLHTESLLPNTQPPNRNPFLLTSSASNSTPSQSKVLTVSLKWRRKLTEKAALYVASRKSWKLKRDRKSAAVIESDEENGWEDVDNASTY
ncbi:hypothetical protein EV424DRAFT_1355409 [Suillus variegatus]|nr:hypothetical protein EV424DRAFT_1355409 [Suillus variegatus]